MKAAEVRTPPATPEGAMWNTAQTAAFLGMSEAWVKKQAQLGLLPATRLGRSLKFDPALVRAFVQGKLPGTEDIVKLTGPRPSGGG